MTERLIDKYLQQMSDRDASDMFFVDSCPPSFRIGGKVVAIDIPPFTKQDIQVLVDDMITEDQADEFESTLELNLALSLPNKQRFRVNMFMQKNSIALVIRLIKSDIPKLKDLNLPDIYGKFIMEKRGLLLLVGATGSGKSTSLASMIDHRNRSSSGHIITIEDPIEFYHEHNMSIVTQREVGIDSYSYGIALKNALRQSPDVVLIGEIRDRETLENAILFCETGHLVVATMHSNNSHNAIDRMVNLFPEEMHKQISLTLSQNLNVILSQRLVKKSDDSGRACAYEIMINEGLITSLILDGDFNKIKEVMEKNLDQGMITFDQCLLNLCRDRIIKAEVAISESDNSANLRLRINQELMTDLLDDDEHY